MAEVALIEKWMNIMFNAITTKGMGPTVTARFQYLMSTIMCYSFVTYKNSRVNPLKEPELVFIYTRERSLNALNNVIQQCVVYLFDLLSLDKSTLVLGNFNINARSQYVVNNLKAFLDRRNNDNYLNANDQITFPNSGKSIQVFNTNQDLSSLDKKTWTPLQHASGGPIQKYLTPLWGNVTPIETIILDKYMQIADENYNVPNKDINRTLEIQEVIKCYDNLNDVQRMIAEYFRGGKVTPPGIWNVIALYTIKSTNINSVNAVQFLYLLNSSMFMSSVVAWAVKYKYMQGRPIQEIRLLDSQQVTTFDGSKVNNKAWKTFQPKLSQTPPFPDYISGHSTFSSTAATVFERYFPNFENINFIPFTNEHGGLITPLLMDGEIWLI